MTRARLLLLAAALGTARPGMADCPGPDRLSEALRILDQAHPPALTMRAAVEAKQRQHDWSAEVGLSYDTNATSEGGPAGGRGTIAVKIPLFDQTSRIEKAETRAAAERERDAMRASLLSEMADYCAAVRKRQAAERARDFAKDRLAYYQQRIDQGLASPDVLWQQAESFQSAERERAELAAAIETEALTLARRWGGDQWPRLLALLHAISAKHD